MGKLTALGVQKSSEVGKFFDGNGLVFQVTKNRAGEIKKSWLVRFVFHGKQREMGIGKFPELGLADARLMAIDVRSQALKGIDPIAARRKASSKPFAESGPELSFKECAELFIKSHEPSWQNPKHRQQWRNTLSTYAYPIIGDMRVADVGVSEVMQILEPIWHSKTETASRVRGRIENILAWAIVREHREAPNPAVWRGHLDHLLPKPSRVSKVTHHAAVEWEEVPDFMVKLLERPAASARALEFTILTAARSGEAREARWQEIDWKKKIWSVPAERMKMRRDHRVPLSSQAIRILKSQQKLGHTDPSDLIFYSQNPDKVMSNSIYRALFKRMKKEGITAHGFRSTFRDWAGERTSHSRETAELALAHNIGDATERSYRRGDSLEKRRLLMDDWADYLYSKAAE